MKKAEGFMLYFDRLDPMRDLSNEEKGEVFTAIWEYAESGVIPELPRNLLPFWKLLRRSIDDGTVRYNEKSIQNAYNRHKGEAKKKGLEPSPIWEWWAKHREYTPELFKKEEWYDDAAAFRQELGLTSVNDGQRASTDVTNTTQTQHEPNTNTITNNITGTNTVTGGAGGPDYDILQSAWTRYREMRKAIGKPLTDEKEAEVLVAKLTEYGQGDYKTMATILDRSTERNWPFILPMGKADASGMINDFAGRLSI